MMTPVSKLATALLVTTLLACSSQAEGLHKVVWTPVREGGLVATYLRPKGDVVRHAIIVVGGSEGGIPQSLAYPFAERGWAVLAVAYFGVKGLPPSLANVPVESLDGAVAWLQRQPLTDTSDLTVVGVSRGSELALLFASRTPSIKRVIAYVPSHVVWGPVGKFEDAAISAWSQGGTALPYVPHAREPDYSAKPYRGTQDFLVDLQQASAVDAAAIPVERIQGPVLLLSAEDDLIWPSTLMSQRLMARLSAAEHPYPDEHVSYPGAGHLISPGSDPGLLEARHPIGVVIAFGGSRGANRTAQKNALAKAIEFLNKAPSRNR